MRPIDVLLGRYTLRVSTLAGPVGHVSLESIARASLEDAFRFTNNEQDAIVVVAYEDVVVTERERGPAMVEATVVFARRGLPQEQDGAA